MPDVSGVTTRTNGFEICLTAIPHWKTYQFCTQISQSSQPLQHAIPLILKSGKVFATLGFCPKMTGILPERFYWAQLPYPRPSLHVTCKVNHNLWLWKLVSSISRQCHFFWTSVPKLTIQFTIDCCLWLKVGSNASFHSYISDIYTQFTRWLAMNSDLL
jgi:hypothetical protein